MTLRQIGLVTEERHDAYLKKMEKIETMKAFVHDTHVNHEDEAVSKYLESLGYEALSNRVSLEELAKRPKTDLYMLLKLAGYDEEEAIAEQCGIEIRYEGYINKAKREAQKMASMEKVHIPDDFDYDGVDNLSIEGRQKLTKYRPATVGQASRISGVNPADLAVLVMYLKAGGKKI